MDHLYERYGKLMLQLEILQNQINECKRAIIDEANKPKLKEEPKDEPTGQ